jgi:hypothetical protein
MDIFSHGLWSVAATKNINLKKSSRFNLYWSAFWGMFPDLFAFGPAVVWLIWLRFKGVEIIPIRPENADALEQNGGGPFLLSHNLYNYSHSIFIFLLVAAAVFAFVYLKNKKISLMDLPISMVGWPLHILMDIPTHSYKFYPTPFLWPFSDWKFNGFSWGQWWFIILNYSLLIFVFFRLRKKHPNQ